MAAGPDAIERDSDILQNVLATCKFGRPRASTGRKWVATWIHMKAFIQFYWICIEPDKFTKTFERGGIASLAERSSPGGIAPTKRLE
jgi:hypothetical protein